ncbi:T-cell surface glycoprotein CD3 gamma chain-like [Acanthopagrus latus]|uniref:T-cell surface glycoprotein CD3 gamma chain-like n=1 Tax=Acanthopagrus latus TaxID=8177 RepID=UPI00187CC930|nr:T-cell surface glycoprotein CD3 gamma chain-like [Acanthopagrus latus]XP_036938113.1 T-cell surface glycoprotein CD3 gamma chain-like [Acanthopagrus latus]
MKCQSALSACLLLLCTLTEFVSYAQGAVDGKINVQFIADGIKLSCKGGKFEKKRDNQKDIDNYLELTYNDENTGEYECRSSSDPDQIQILSKIYVKFRTCDNCIELDGGTIAGLVTGNVVATIVIGVAVYLVVSQTRISPSTSHKKSSDRQHLVANEMPRGTNDHYQPLNTRTRQGDTYDTLHK